MNTAPGTRTAQAAKTPPADSARAAGAKRAQAKDVQAPFEQVKHYLKSRLAAGEWTPGTLMPSEAALVQHFAVSRMTVNRALRELQLEGLVDRVQGVGTFAAQLHRVSSSLVIRDIHEDWVQVTYPGGLTGWVQKKHLIPEQGFSG